MKYKLLSLSLAIICIVLAINYRRVYKQLQRTETPSCSHTDELEKLEAEKESWLKREADFLKQNGELVAENNELKMQLERKPLIIYRNVQKSKIDNTASKHYTDVLRSRYGTNSN